LALQVLYPKLSEGSVVIHGVNGGTCATSGEARLPNFSGEEEPRE